MLKAVIKLMASLPMSKCFGVILRQIWYRIYLHWN